MSESLLINGAKATVNISFQGSMQELAAIITKDFLHVDFQFEKDSDPPYGWQASAEVLGCEVWLTSCDREAIYVFQFETTHCLEESFNDQMFDMSPWLSRYFSQVCELKVISKCHSGQST